MNSLREAGVKSRFLKRGLAVPLFNKESISIGNTNRPYDWVYNKSYCWVCKPYWVYNKPYYWVYNKPYYWVYNKPYCWVYKPYYWVYNKPYCWVYKPYYWVYKPYYEEYKHSPSIWKQWELIGRTDNPRIPNASWRCGNSNAEACWLSHLEILPGATPGAKS